jgi:BlaI family penicillinase repressor
MNNTQKKTRPWTLGELEQLLMEFVWSHGPCTAEACRKALAPIRLLKDSTVRTVLRRLEEKGYLTHEVDGRTFVYRATQHRRSVAARAAQQIIERFCGGSVEQLLVGMVENSILDREELELLARKIAQRKKKKS